MAEIYNVSADSLYDAINQSVRRIGLIQDNIENAQTVGYKSVYSDSVLFADTMKQVFRDDSQGSFVPTNEKLDLALSKSNAFFLVEGPEGPLRTRDGQFHISSDKKIVDVQGRELVILDQDPEKPAAEYFVNNSDIDIDKKGIIRADGLKIGRVVVDYQSKGPGDVAFVIQGKLEASNVDIQENVTKMLQVKRHIDTVQGMLSMELSVDKALIETYGRNI